MCGITGILHTDLARPVERERVDRMRDLLMHRGPDGCGTWVDGPVGFGHRRLAIVDVQGGQQPMTSDDGRYTIVFNGEIYNHPELMQGLKHQGVRYRTRCDTETILHLYERHGERCVDHLRGMFAFAIWDRRDHALLLARDRLGIKPLYYALAGDTLLFASEIKALFAAGPLRPRMNHAVLPDFLGTRYVATDETFFSGVHKLQPGTVLRWTRGSGVITRRYWTLPTQLDSSDASFHQRAVDLRERLTASIRSHLMSDVPLGVFLSGGLDSSALLGILAREVKEPIRTFSVGFEEREANELAYARVAARAAKSEHREVVVTPRDFFEALPRLIWHEDEPIAFPSSVPLHFVSRLARKHVKVVLTGEGADELFLGYDRYRITAWNDRLAHLLPQAHARQIRAFSKRVAQRLPAKLARFAERSFLSLPPGPRALFCENFSVFTADLRDELLADTSLRLARDPHAVAIDRYTRAQGGPLERMGQADLQTYLVELLMKQDQMSMAASIESRVPFLDHELVEHVVAMPARFKVRGFETKAILRAAVKDVVPGPILQRKKLGFPVPLASWLRGPFWPVVEQLVLSERALARGLFRRDAVRQLAHEHKSGWRNHADRLWLLINLELWQRVFFEGELDAKQLAA